MEPAPPLAARCAALARALAAEESWDLDTPLRDSLVALAVRSLPPTCSDAQLRTAILNIHRVHLVVEALRAGAALGYADTWAAWLGQARAILRHAGLDWAHDGAVDLDDLAQIALLELARSLPSYRYASRFSTWAYQVITRGVQRHLRDLAAQKRAGNIDYGTDPLQLARPIAAGEQPEAQVDARLLEETVEARLAAAMGARNALVFRLWACHDLSVEVIGRRVGLSTARVHAILAQARQYLQGDPAIQGWREGSSG